MIRDQVEIGDNAVIMMGAIDQYWMLLLVKAQ